MKKLTLTIGCALAVAGAAFAQGTIQWVGGSTSLSVQTNSTLYSPFVIGGGGATGSGAIGLMGTGAQAGAASYYFTLLNQTYSGSQAAAPTTLAALQGWSTSWADPAVYATNGSVAGRPIMTPASDTGQTVTWANATTQSVMLVGWSANLGTSWNNVLNELNNWATVQSTITTPAWVGVSATGYINPGQANPGSSIFGSAAVANVGLPIYNPTASAMQLLLLPIPEPSTLAVAGLGGLSLLLFRRQRK